MNDYTELKEQLKQTKAKLENTVPKSSLLAKGYILALDDVIKSIEEAEIDLVSKAVEKRHSAFVEWISGGNYEW